MTTSQQSTTRIKRWHFITAVGFCLLLAATGLILGYVRHSHKNQPSTNAQTETKAQQTVLRDNNGRWLATFTNGARTVIVAGPSRTFAEPSNTTATVTSTTWVRLYPKAFNGSVDQEWLKQAQADNTHMLPDILQTAMQYIDDAPTITTPTGLRIAGDASYGPLLPDGKHQEGSDFNDYLGISQAYGTNIDTPEANQKGSLDCSGFQRMVWGYRNRMPLGLDSSNNGTVIPRRSYQILASAPGVIIAADHKRQLTDLSKLQVGDLVFHDASTNDGDQIDHVGIYLGIDSTGNHRFISSRKTADGPTLGDVGGKSILEGSGLYAKSFRAIRRL